MQSLNNSAPPENKANIVYLHMVALVVNAGRLARPGCPGERRRG